MTKKCSKCGSELADIVDIRTGFIKGSQCLECGIVILPSGEEVIPIKHRRDAEGNWYIEE